MKIAILGSAPSSLRLAPFGDPTWKIWGCSPGVYSQCPRANAWFELHRWEPGIIGVPSSQKQWFSPEYVAWMAKVGQQGCAVWMYEPVPEIPGSRALPVDDLQEKYGTYFFTSSIAWMIACAIEDILEQRAERQVIASAAPASNPTVGEAQAEPDAIALYGIDMAATEEYGYQRAGCQHFLLLAADLGIRIVVPPESDLLQPMPLYGICESSPFWIKMTERKREIQARINNAQANLQAITNELHFCRGVMEDIDYQMQTWGTDRIGAGVSVPIRAHDPEVRAHVLHVLASIPPAPMPATIGSTIVQAGVTSTPSTEPPTLTPSSNGLDSFDRNMPRVIENGRPDKVYTGRVRKDPKPRSKARKR